MGNQSSQINVGIDVDKAQLDVYIHERDIHLTVENSVEGVRTLLARLNRYHLTRVVLEATGRYEHLLADMALAKDMPIIIANPLQVRRYAGAVGQLAKTDKIDARIIAEYAAVIQPEVHPHSNQNISAIKDLLARRRQLLGMSTMEAYYAESATGGYSAPHTAPGKAGRKARQAARSAYRGRRPVA